MKKLLLLLAAIAIAETFPHRYAMKRVASTAPLELTDLDSALMFRYPLQRVGDSLSLAKSGVVAGTYGDATHVPQFTVDSFGIVKSVTNVTITGGGGGGGGGTVTSVGLALPASVFAVSGSPVVGMGTLTGTFNSQSANTVFAAPNGSPGVPAFRAFLPGDITFLTDSITAARTYALARIHDTADTLRSYAKGRIHDSLSVLTASRIGAEPTVAAGVSSQYWRGDKTWATFPTSWEWTAITGTPTTLSGYGITDALSVSTPHSANTFLAAPNGSSGAATFRPIVAADVPVLNQNTTGSAATLAVGRTIGTTGDVVWTSPSFNGSANVTANSTIQPGVVTLPKMANLAANSIIGNNTGSAATPIALTAAQTKGLLAISASDVSGISATAPITYSSGVIAHSTADGYHHVPATGTTSAGKLLVPGSTAGSEAWVAMSGDATISSAGALTLASLLTAGSAGSGTQVPVLTYDAKGRLTAVSTTTVTPAWSSITSKPTTISGYGITDALPVNNPTFTGSLNGPNLSMLGAGSSSFGVGPNLGAQTVGGSAGWAFQLGSGNTWDLWSLASSAWTKQASFSRQGGYAGIGNGSSSLGAGPNIGVQDGSSNGWVWQLGASGVLDLWNLSGGWSKVARFDPGGALALSGNLTTTGATIGSGTGFAKLINGVVSPGSISVSDLPSSIQTVQSLTAGNVAVGNGSLGLTSSTIPADGPWLPLSGGKRISGWTAFDADVYPTTYVKLSGYDMGQFGIDLKTAFQVSGVSTWSFNAPVSFDATVRFSDRATFASQTSGHYTGITLHAFMSLEASGAVYLDSIPSGSIDGQQITVANNAASEVRVVSRVVRSHLIPAGLSRTYNWDASSSVWR